MDIKIILWLLGAGIYVFAGVLFSVIIGLDRSGAQGGNLSYGPITAKLFNWSNENLTMAGIVLAWPVVAAFKFLKL